MEKKAIVCGLLSATLQKGRVGSLKNLRKAFLESEFSQDALAKKLVAYAHVSCLSFDAREIYFAINAFHELKEWEELANILRICKTYNLFKPILQIMQIGIKENISELKFPEFSSWFRKSVKWFELYYDPDGFFFIPEEECMLIKQIASEQPGFWDEVLSDQELTGIRRDLLEKIVNNKLPVVPAVNKRKEVEKQFFDYCDSHGISVIKRLQKGMDSPGNKCSYVYLVFDNDGIFKVYKELLDYNERLRFEHEGLAYRCLPESDFLPRCYGGPEGIVNIGDHKFLRLSVHFGQSLADYVKPGNLLSENEAAFVTGKIAQKLSFLKKNRVLYLDLKPENILLDKNDVKLLDLGIVKILENGRDAADVFLADSRYATPEGSNKFTASEASLVYQLGILFFQLLTGKHPFDIAPELDGENTESAIIKYVLPSIAIEPDLGKIKFSIISDMLSKDPAKRPSLDEVSEKLNMAGINIKQKGRERRQRKNNTILFIGRMGIPHKGHIEYISRFLEMGFFVRIAISKAYTITDDDPIPKWIVMKMIAKSLIKKGFSQDDFEFFLTPFYESDEQLRMHFLMFPQEEDILGVASNNPRVWNLFPNHEIFDQKSVFGYEHEDYEVLSWGKILRKAVKDGDYGTFVSYAAEGAEEILAFSEIRKIYGKPGIEFVPGKVIAILLDSGKEILRCRVLKYSTPEQSLVFHLKSKGHFAEIADPYSLTPEFSIDGVKGKLHYEGIQFDSRDETITFRFEKGDDMNGPGT